MDIKLEINNHELTATIYENPSTEGLLSFLANTALILNLEDFMQVEKLGDIGMTLPAKDSKVRAKPGSLMLYMGSMLALVYEETEDRFTKLGRINNVTEGELRSILGTGKCRIKLSM